MSNQPDQYIDHGFPPGPPPGPRPPIQFKRGSSKAFWVKNPILRDGEPAVELDTYRMKVGDGRTRYNSLPYLGEGHNGKSAYQLWIDAGHVGSIEDFLEYCIGPAGKSAYEIWLAMGNEGSVVDFINSLHGEKGDPGTPGKSAYELWLEDGHTGTLTDFLNSLIGKSAYQIWLDLGHTGTEADFIASLKGDKGDPGDDAFEVWKKATGQPEATVDDYIRFLCLESWATF